MAQVLQHKHLIVRAEVTRLPHPEDGFELQSWVKQLIRRIDMKLLSGPHVAYVDIPGNVGWTGVAIIETSHIAIHTWSEPDPKLVQLDVYSCATFDPDVILKALDRQFGIISAEYVFLDREHRLATLGTGLLMQDTRVSGVDMLDD